jgi:lipid-binding SYLF domain-containing protein
MNLNMEKIIESCNEVLDDDVTKNGIPDHVWKSCKGVAIITASEIGFVYAVSEGDGLVIKKNDDGTWGAPSNLRFGGNAAGAIMGKATKQIFLFPMTDHELKRFFTKTLAERQRGGQIGIAVGPVGREAEAGANMRQSEDVTFSYTFQKGAMMNIGYNDYVLEAVDKKNEDFYGKTAKAIDIVMTPGTVEVPTGKGIEELHEKLAALSKM